MTGSVGAFGPVYCRLANVFTDRLVTGVCCGLDGGGFVVGEADRDGGSPRVGALGSAASVGFHEARLAHTWIEGNGIRETLRDNEVLVYAKPMTTIEEPFECFECEQPITGQPVRDSEQISWLGDRAETYCSAACLDAAAEAYFERMSR